MRPVLPQKLVVTACSETINQTVDLRLPSGCSAKQPNSAKWAASGLTRQ